MRCEICGAEGMHDCDICHRIVCSSHYNVRASLCVECAGIPKRGRCEVCGGGGVLRRCADCGRRVCERCYDLERQLCRRCSKKFFKD